MRYASLLLVATCTTLCTYAQPAPQRMFDRKSNNEIGLMGDINLQGRDLNFDMFGLQFKHWKNKVAAYRLAIGYGEYFNHLRDRYLPSGNADTVLKRSIDFKMPMTCIGLGLEWQKKFKRKLYLYAAAELKLGYGKGYYDTTYTYTDIYSERARIREAQSGNSGAFYAGFSPILGVKVNLKRWVIGTEFSDPVHFVSRDDGRGRLNDLNFDFASLNQRVYFNYRF